LDIARGEKVKGFTPATAEVLRNWQDPASLAVVQGTPINCLVVSWASGLPADAEQQKALTPLIEKGKQAGLDFVGLIEGEGDKAAAVAAAQAAGLAAVAMAGDAPANAAVPVIPWNKAAQVRSSAKSAVMGVSDGVFPGLPQGATPQGGPTNLPWVDSNGAILMIARALAPDKTVWVGFDPALAATQAAEAYELAVADSASHGARWVISLDDGLRADLAAKKQPAADTFKKLIDTVTFFEQHKELRTYQPNGLVAIISNFSGQNYDPGEEAINLMPRVRQPFRLIARSRAASASFAGLQAIYYLDKEPPDAALRKKLLAFANDGGILLVPSNWPNPAGPPAPAEPYLLFSMRKVGKGRLGVCKEEKPDAYDTVADIQNIISHGKDLVRVYNAPSSNFLYATSAQGKQAVIHLLNYSRRGGDALFYVKEPYKSARVVSPELPSSAELQFAPQEAGGSELTVPRISVYGVIELEN